MKTKLKQTQSKKKVDLVFWGLLTSVTIILISLLVVPGLLPAKAVSGLMPMEVKPGEVYQAWQSGGFILDVREPEEWIAGHIPNATLIPLGQLASRVSELPRDVPVYVVCRSGNRSATGRDILIDAGFSSVTSMAGGMNDWVRNGYEITIGP
jgi:rhodanese-related sulfurtransferase